MIGQEVHNTIYIAARDRKFILLLAIVMLFFYLLGLSMDSSTPTDAAEYIKMSENIYKYGVSYTGDLSEPLNYDEFTKRPPLYPLFMGVASLLGNAWWLLHLLQTVMVCVGIYLVRNLAYSFSYKKSYDIYLLAAIVFLPSLWIYPQLAMSESLLFLFLCLSVFYLIKGIGSSQGDGIVLSILFLGLSPFIKPVMLPLVVLASVTGLMYGLVKRRWSIFLMSILVVLFLGSYMGYNYQRTGSMSFSSISAVNLVDYNTYYFNIERGGKEFAQAKRNEIYASASARETYAEQLSARNSGGAAIVLEHPVSYGLFHLKGLPKFFLFPGRYDVFTFFGLDQQDFMIDKVAEEGYFYAAQYLVKTTPLWLLLLVGFSFIVKFLLAIGIVFFIFHRSVPIGVKLVCLGLIFYIAVLTGPLGAARFFMPVGGLYLIVSVVGLGNFIDRLKSQRG